MPVNDNSQTSEEGEEENIFSNPRYSAMATLAKAYKNTSYVKRALANRQTTETLSNRSTTDHVSAFLREAGSYALLSAEEEGKLFRDIEDGLMVYDSIDSLVHISAEQEAALLKLTAAQQILYYSNLRLIVNIAKPLSLYSNMPLLDLVQEGVVGLFTGIARFDASKGFKFSTFATWWVRQAITRAVADKSRIIRIPVYLHEQYVKAKGKVKKQEEALGRPLDNAEIEQITGLGIDAYTELMRSGMTHIPSLNNIVKGRGVDGEFQDFVADPTATIEHNIGQYSDQTELKQILSSANLKPKEKFIIGLRYGIDPKIIGSLTIQARSGTLTYEDAYKGTEKQTLEEIGDLFGVTRERIRQLESKGMEVLQYIAIKSKHNEVNEP